jgi:ribonuclease P protein component
MKNTLSKAERLCSKKWIEQLHKEGKSFRIYPLKITVLPHSYTTSFPLMMMVSSPKHLFKHANERNLTKRRMREAYRKNKHELSEKCKMLQTNYFISFQYANKKIEAYSIIETALKKALRKIQVDFLSLHSTENKQS